MKKFSSIRRSSIRPIIPVRTGTGGRSAFSVVGLSILLIAFSSFAAYSQACIPMWTDTTHGISPDTLTNLPPAYVGSPYDAVVQFRVPTSAPSPFGGVISIDHIVLTNVEGLSAIPAEVPFYFQCNPPGCSFHSDSVACVTIKGTPSTIGTYNLTIETNVYITQSLYSPYLTTGYRIVVHNPIGIPPVNQTKFDVSQNLPNPVATNADIYVNLQHAGNFTLKVSNLVGNEVLKQTIAGKKGLNTVNLDASQFSPGIYFYSVSDGENSMTKRMVVDRK
jgi:hypothetical protein